MIFLDLLSRPRTIFRSIKDVEEMKCALKLLLGHMKRTQAGRFQTGEPWWTMGVPDWWLVSCNSLPKVIKDGNVLYVFTQFILLVIGNFANLGGYCYVCDIDAYVGRWR